nr:hypothetical protein [Deinococcus budaensis]
MTSWADLVDLYEYRVADVLAGRRPRGGRRALSDLHEALRTAPLTPALTRRLRQADRQYRAHQQSAGPGPEREAASGPSPAGWAGAAPGDPAEAQAWTELRWLGWQAGLRARLAELGSTLQAEPDTLSLRVLYAALETADREARGQAAGLAVPGAGDPLAALHRPEVLAGLLSALGELLGTPQGPARLRAALARVQETPFPRHPDADVLAARIQAAQREPISLQAREALIQALRAPYPPERDPRERPAIREAARRLSQRLDALLEGAPAGAGETGPGGAGPLRFRQVPARSILYAATSAALETPGDAASELVIHLPGGREARWRGLTLRWQPIGANWQLQVGGELTLLRPGRPAAERVQTVQTPGARLLLAVSGAYLRLQVLDPPSGPPQEPQEGAAGAVQAPAAPAPAPSDPLEQLAARARVVAALLDPADHHAPLRLARAAARQLRGGALDPAAFGPASAERYAAAPPDLLLALARKGAGALLAHAARLAPEALDGALEAGAAALALPPARARTLQARLRAALVPPPLAPPSPPGAPPTSPAELALGGPFLRFGLGGRPVTLRAAGCEVTLRLDEEGRALVSLPGQAEAVLDDLLVLPLLPGADLLLVRQGREVAAALEAARLP